VVAAAVAAGVILVLGACTQLTSQQQPTNSPEATPSTPAETPTPSTAPTPLETPPPAASPSPSPAKLIITSVTFHMGEVGLAYGAVTAGAAGGVKPYKWSISSGGLPSGLALSSAGKTTGKPTAAGTFSFVIRVDDSAGGAAGVTRSILVFRQLVFNVTTATCPDPTTKLNNCAAASNAALHIPYSGGTPGAKPIVKITGVNGATIGTPLRGGCLVFSTNPTTNPPPGMTVSASGGVMTLSAGPPDQLKWCHYSGTITFVLVNPSPCGAGFLCTSSNTLSVRFNL